MEPNAWQVTNENGEFWYGEDDGPEDVGGWVLHPQNADIWYDKAAAGRVAGKVGGLAIPKPQWHTRPTAATTDTAALLNADAKSRAESNPNLAASVDTSPHAFPRPASHSTMGQQGMSLRDYFAGQALVSIFAGEGARMVAERDGRYDETNWAEVVADNAYAMADAMISQRRKVPTNPAKKG